MSVPIAAAGVIVAGLASIVATAAFLTQATARGWGKAVRRDGPRTHLVKEGTPTMGGVAILAATAAVTTVLLATVPMADEVRMQTAAVLALTLASGVLGWWDDRASLLRKRRIADGEDASTGILARWRLVGQGLVSLAFGAFAVRQGFDMVGVPALDVLAFAFVVTGTINALNMTDGLDGLAAGCGAIMLLAFFGHPMAAALLGALLGFLVFNAHPAKVFMGGVGSEALGAAIAGLAIVHGDVWRLPLLALVPLAETASVIVQVAYFRATGGRRLFKMSPLHHHFEMIGWPETTVVLRFWVVTALVTAATVLSRGSA